MSEQCKIWCCIKQVLSYWYFATVVFSPTKYQSRSQSGVFRKSIICFCPLRCASRLWSGRPFSIMQIRWLIYYSSTWNGYAFCGSLRVSHLLSNLDHNKSAGPTGCCRVFWDSLHQSYQTTSPISSISPFGLVNISNIGTMLWSSLSNYWLINQTFILCKVLEGFIRNATAEHLKTYGLFQEAWHRYLNSRSYLTKLDIALEMVTQAMNDGKDVDLCFLEFS